MTDMLGYVVMRYETPLDDSPGVGTCIEKVFLCEDKAKEYRQQLDPSGKGFEYHCPCGCGDEHYRAWYVEPVCLNLKTACKQAGYKAEQLDAESAKILQDNFWELVMK